MAETNEDAAYALSLKDEAQCLPGDLAGAAAKLAQAVDLVPALAEADALTQPLRKKTRPDD